ncbi:unnamed protein product [Mycena citricolor]|uniref:FAD-binding domain-containing protein n=1 Tax=Mycena citricolor TaxID=2018698 RepID=A0AAD2H5R5_9AGAR|nr:unnamed protein product [Mycena citricolor]
MAAEAANPSTTTKLLDRLPCPSPDYASPSGRPSGGGIGGLTLALALSRYPDIEVQIYEAAKSLSEVGAGVGIFPRPWKIVQLLGLDHDLAMTCETKPVEGPVAGFNYRKSDQGAGFAFSTLVTNGSLLTFHRADFQNVLLSHLPSSTRIHMSKRLHTFVQRPSGPTELVFEDGTRSFCDVLVGADGLKSNTRRAFLSERIRWMQDQGRWQEAREIETCIEPVWSGCTAYRALFPAERLRALAPSHQVLTKGTQYLGKGAFVLGYPIQNGKIINFVAFDFRHELEGTPYGGPWMSLGDKSQFAHLFENWEPDVQLLIQCVDQAATWAIHTVKPLRSFVSGNVALLGDAAHAMQPHQGSGAGQAMEDAYILATILGDASTTRETLGRSLRIYDEIRRPAAQHIASASRLNGRYFSFEEDPMDGLEGQQLWDRLQHLYQRVVKNWEWAWTTTIDDQVKEALRQLKRASR